MSTFPDLQFAHIMIVPHFAKCLCFSCALCLDHRRPLPLGYRFILYFSNYALSFFLFFSFLFVAFLPLIFSLKWAYTFFID